MILGIDLGTTNSLACVFKEGKIQLIPNKLGDYLTPSVVGLDDEGQLIVGKVAKERLLTHPDKTVAQFKRLMGTSKKLFLGGKQYSPEELSSFIIRKLVEDAQEYLGEPIEEVVVSVPAYFNNRQRSATRNAAALSGVSIERIINEPSAAALAIHQDSSEDKTYMVIDFGGGTLDISVVDAFENVIEIVAVSGDNHLGGEDFTQLIVDDFIEQKNLKRQFMNNEFLEAIWIESEKSKLLLNKQDEVDMTVTFGGVEYKNTLSYHHFFQLATKLLVRIDAPLKQVIKDSSYSLEDIDRIILVGGTSKMRLVKDFLTYSLKRKVEIGLDPDTVIAQGCGVVAGIKERNQDVKDLLLTDICPFSLGLEIGQDGLFSIIIERNTILPSSRQETYQSMILGQSRIRIKIYQGEHIQAEANELIGELSVPIPVNHQHHENILVRYTYDINGILDVDVKVVSTGEVFSKTIIQSDTYLSEDEIEKRREELAKLKFHPKETEEYHYLVARANRLFETLLGEKRLLLQQAFSKFEQVMDKQDPKQSKQAIKDFKNFLDRLEDSY